MKTKFFNFLKVKKTTLFVGIAIIVLILNGIISYRGNLNIDDNSYSKKQMMIENNGVRINATYFFKNGKVTKIEGEFFILESPIIDPNTFDKYFLFWSEENGYSSTLKSIFKIISEYNREEIEKRLISIINEQE